MWVRITYIYIYIIHESVREREREREGTRTRTRARMRVCVHVRMCVHACVCVCVYANQGVVHTYITLDNIRRVLTIPSTHSNLNIDTQKSTYVTNPVTAQIRLGTGRMHLVVWHGSCWYQIYLRHELHKTHFVTDVTHELIESVDTDIVYMFICVHI